MTQFDLRLEAVGKSDRGIKRTNNEDAFAIHLPTADRPDALFMVADGIGGLSKGEVASRLALETILKHYFTTSPDADASGKLDPGARLLGALQVANQEVLSKAMADMDRMGSTVAGILIDYRRQATVFNVGDSRVYRIRNGAIAQLSQDQVLDIPAAPSEQGGMPRRTSKLLFFIGQNRPLEPYFERFTVQPGDSFVLCSDGLWSLVKSQEILDLLNTQSAQNAADHLIELARQRGAPDNVTVVIIHTRELQRNALLPMAVAGTVVIALAAVGFVFLQSRNAPQAADSVQTEAASTMSALQGSATLTETIVLTSTPTPIPPTVTPSASFTASPTLTPMVNTTLTQQAIVAIQAASETAAVLATASADAQAATDAVSTISSAAIATSGAQATGTMQEAQIGTRVAETQTAIASITPSATPSATATVSFTPSVTATVTKTATTTPSLSASATPSMTNAPSRVITATSNGSRTTAATDTAAATHTPQPAGLRTLMSSSDTPTSNATVSSAQPTDSVAAASGTPTRTSAPTVIGATVQPSRTLAASTMPKTVTLADGTVLPVDLDITYQLFSGTRKIYYGPGSRYGLVIEIESGAYKYPVLARLTGSFYWYLILLPDNQTGWIALPSSDNFARIDTVGTKTLVQIPQLAEPATPTATNTPTSVK